MKMMRLLSITLVLGMLFSYCFSTSSVAFSLQDENTSASTDAAPASSTEETVSKDNEISSPEAETDETTVDMLNEQMLSEYEADGTLPERQSFMQTLQSLNEPYYSTFSINADDSLNVNDIANIVPEKNPANMPTTGEAKVLVFLVDFPDMPHDPEETREVAEDVFFGEDSLSSFYYKSSYNKLTIDGDVRDWYTAEHNREYYLENGIAALYNEVLDAFDDQIDYSQYDADGNSYIDGLYLHFAGDNSGWGSTFWSYVTWLFEKEYDGVKIGARACLLHKLDVPTIRHETGHLLGLPDYYSYTIKTCWGNYSWVGGKDMMVGGYGDHNAVSKMLLGWINQVKLIAEEGEYSLEDFEKNGDAAIVYPFGHREGDSFFVMQKETDSYTGDYKIKIFRVNALLSTNPSDGTTSYVHSNIYGEVPFIQLVAELKNGESANPYNTVTSTHYYNEETKSDTFSGITVNVPENGLLFGNPVRFNVIFEAGPSIIDPPVIQATATVNQVTAIIDFSVPFSVNGDVSAYLIDEDGTRIATMDTKTIFSDDRYYIDKASCVLRVASYLEWGYDGKNEITVGKDQDYLLKPGGKYTVVIPAGVFKTVMGDIDEIRIDVTADATADQNAKYQPITTFDKCSEFITLSDGRVAYAYVDVKDSARPLKLVLLSEDGTKQEYMIEEGITGYVGICQLSDGTVAMSCADRTRNSTFIYKFDIETQTVISSLDIGELVDKPSKLFSFNGGFYLSAEGCTDSRDIIEIDNAMQQVSRVLPELAMNDYNTYGTAKIIIDDRIMYISYKYIPEKYSSSDYYGYTNKFHLCLYDSNGEILSENDTTIYDRTIYIGAAVYGDNQIAVASYDIMQQKIRISVFDEKLRLLEVITPDFSTQMLDAINAYAPDFKRIGDSYFMSYNYVRQYNPYGADIGAGPLFSTETYQQGVLFDDKFNVKSAFDVAYTASAAALGKEGNCFIVGDEYGYYTVNTELTSGSEPILLYSDAYTVDNEVNTITGVPSGTTAENILKFIQASAEDCRYEFRYTHACRSREVRSDEIISCNYELLVYDPSDIVARIYTFPELPPDYDSSFQVSFNYPLYNSGANSNMAVLCDYTATEEKLVIPDFVEMIYLDSRSGYDVNFNSVTSLTTSAAVSGYGLSNLQELNLLEGCTTIGSSGFSFCHKLKKVVIPNTVTEIRDSAFENCSSLEEIIIPASVTRIGNYAFCNTGDRSKLKIIYQGTREQWEKIDFRRFDFDIDGEKYGFYDWESAFGDYLVFAGSGMIDSTAPEFEVSGVSVSAENNDIGFKVKKSLFEDFGYVQPGLQVILNSNIDYLTNYTVSGDYYVFTLPNVAPENNGKTAFVTSMGYYNGTLCLSDVFEYVVGTVPVTGFTLDKTTVSAETGDETLTLTAIINPEDATNKNVRWTTSDKSIATVSDGVVTLIKEGIVKITAVTEDGNFSASCVITISCSHKNYHEVLAEESTCVKHGHQAYSVCDDCGRIIEGSSEELPLGDHVGETYLRGEKEATLSEEGYSGDICCSACDQIITVGHTLPKLILGDANGDGIVNAVDSSVILRRLAGWSIEINSIAADVNSDGVVDSKDAAIISRKISGWNASFN